MFNNDDVLKYLPHRDPFLFIDSVESLANEEQVFTSLNERSLVELKGLPGHKAVAIWNNPESHSIYKGHFPGNPILPGVVQVEMIAQAASFVLAMAHEDPFVLDSNVALLSVQSAKFRKPVGPGKQLKIETKCTRVRGTMMSYEGLVFCEGELMSEATVMVSVNRTK